LTAPATAAWRGCLHPPLPYVSFGFFQPLFLAALAGGTIAATTAVRALRREASRGELIAAGAAVLAGAAATLPFAREMAGGLVHGLGYVAGSTREIGGTTGYVSYPKDWLKGIFEARPLLADGPGLAWHQPPAA